ncbi:hypothetical protein ACGFZZ_17915 [Streptomyces tendae]|uniref:hypothetical protein n=1 Tax=Streptomyces tendae TaxID=1932 RepID=UPI00371FDCBD
MTTSPQESAKDREREPAPPVQGHPQRWLILGVISLAQLTVVLDNTVLNVAIPSLTDELGAATSDIQWMINAYSLVQSGLLLTAGSAADLPHALRARGDPHRPQEDAGHRPRPVRDRVTGGRTRGHHRPVDRGTGRHGPAWASAAPCC